MINTILFDLDGTLLPMDQKKYVEYYLGMLAKWMEPHGYDPKLLVKTIWDGTDAMVENDGTRSNEAVFWELFCRVFGPEAMKDQPTFHAFYEKQYPCVRPSCGYDPRSAELIGLLKDKGYRLILATNPIFPASATCQRIGWAGLRKEDFELVTAYENSRFCKPNPDYYRDILEKQGLKAENCMMIGNDVTEDMVAGTLGMETYLLTDWIINKYHKDITQYRHGTMAELLELARGWECPM